MSLLFYLVSGAAALGLVHRFLYRIGWRAALALIAAPLPFVGAALVTASIYAPIDLPYNAEPLKSISAAHGIDSMHNGQLSDLYTQMIPWRAAVRHAWSLGEWPHLNPFMLSGDALAGAAQPAPYHPLTLISLLLPPGHDLTYTAAIALLLAMLGGFCWARELRCGELPALITGFTWMACDFVLFWIGWPIGVTASALPWILIAVARLVSRQSPGSVVLLTGVLSWLLLAGHPETVLHHVAIGAAFGLWRMRELAQRERVRSVTAAILAGVVAFAISAVATLPFLESMNQTFESEYRSEVWRHSKKSVSWSEAGLNALPSAVPFAYGRSGSELGHVEETRRLIPSTAFAGIIPLALAWIGFRRGERRDRLFLGGLFVASLWIGSEAPGLTDFVGSLPLFSITLNDRLILGCAFVIATFAGLGAQAWLRYPLRVRLAVTIAGAAVIVGLLAAMAGPHMIGEWKLSGEFARAQAALTLIPPLAAAALVLLPRNAVAVMTLLLALLVTERVVVSGRFYPTLPSEAFYPEFPGLETFERGDTPWRMVGRSYTFIPSTAALYGLEDVRGYQAVTNARFHQAMSLWSVPQPVWFNRVDDLNAPMLRMLNVRYAIVDDMALPLPPGWREAFRARRYRIVEMIEPLGRAYVPERVVATGSTFPEAMRSNRDFEKLSWIGPPIGTDSAHNDSAPAGNGSGSITTRRDGLGFRITARMARAGWVVVSQVAWNGWRAVNDRGREIPLHYANHAWLAMPLEAGTHEISLRFEPRYFGIALAGTVAGLLAWIALIAYTLVTGRANRRAQEW